MLKSLMGLTVFVLLISVSNGHARTQPEVSRPCKEEYNSNKNKCHVQKIRCLGWSDNIIYECPDNGPTGPYTDICENAYDSCMWGAYDDYLLCLQSII